MGDTLYYAAMANTVANVPSFYAGKTQSVDLCSVSACFPHVLTYNEPNAPPPTVSGSPEGGVVNCPVLPSAGNPCVLTVQVNVADVGNPNANSLLEEVGGYAFASSHPQNLTTNAQALADNVPLEIDGVCCYNFKAAVVNPPPPTCTAGAIGTQTSTIVSNFNGTPIAAGRTIWFNSVLKASGVSTTAPTAIQLRNAHVLFSDGSTSYDVSVPNANITYSPTATTATTTYDSGTNSWNTTVPASGLAGNTWLSGVGFQVPNDLPGGINPVAFRGTFVSNTPGVTLNWQWGAAVYTQFNNSDPNQLGVKPVDDNKASAYQNSDHAGTPENYRPYVIGGARGGGGSNYTGSYSGTASLRRCD
jgi:hypothetical protein